MRKYRQDLHLLFWGEDLYCHELSEDRVYKCIHVHTMICAKPPSLNKHQTAAQCALDSWSQDESGIEVLAAVFPPVFSYQNAIINFLVWAIQNFAAHSKRLICNSCCECAAWSVFFWMVPWSITRQSRIIYVTVEENSNSCTWFLMKFCTTKRIWSFV